MKNKNREKGFVTLRPLPGQGQDCLFLTWFPKAPALCRPQSMFVMLLKIERVCESPGELMKIQILTQYV